MTMAAATKIENTISSRTSAFRPASLIRNTATSSTSRPARVRCGSRRREPFHDDADHGVDVDPIGEHHSLAAAFDAATGEKLGAGRRIRRSAMALGEGRRLRGGA
jgi:hypothetical protein